MTLPASIQPTAALDWWLAAAVAIIGAALRVRQYAAGSALWLDELALARTIFDRPLLPLHLYDLAARAGSTTPTTDEGAGASRPAGTPCDTGPHVPRPDPRIDP